MDNRITKKTSQKMKIKHKLYIPPHLRQTNCNSTTECSDSDAKTSEEKLCNNSHLLFQTYKDREMETQKLSEKESKQLLTSDPSRPKTCSAAVKRLVSSALGVRIVISNREKEIEQEIMRHLKNKRKKKA